MIKIRRVYEAPSPSDGVRILVDRLWPRGLKKEKAGIDEWMKELAPSSDLRNWFNHDPGKWSEFRKRFRIELDLQKEAVDRLVSMSRKGTVTLLFGSKEERFNNAVALKEYLETRTRKRPEKKAA